MTAISNTTANFIFPLTETHSYLTLTHLNLTAINNAFNQGKRAFASHNYQQAIQSYTIALNHLYDDLESTILLHRAVANEKLCNYQPAIDDCIKIKNRTRDNNPDVYWVTANILLGQGKLKQAATIYKKGLNNLSGHHRKQFEKRYHDVVAAQIDHNQWLARLLPYEVLTSILLLLPWSSRGQLALTCRFWYKFILKGWSEMWSCIDPVHMMLHHPRAIYQLLDLVQSHQVRKVKINLCGLYLRADKEDNETINKIPKLYGMGDLSQLILKTILKQNWNKIKYLEISPLNNDQLRSVLQVNKDSIKHLTLHHQTNNNHCSPEEMLIDVTQTCSHLSTVVHNVSGNEIHIQNIKTILSNAPSSSNLHLTKLILRCKITLESLIHIFKRALYLNFLELQNHELDHAGVLKIIYEHCPRLQTLSYFGKPHYCTGSLSATYTYSTIAKSSNNNNNITLLVTNTSSYNYRSSSGSYSLKFLTISIKMDRADQELDRAIQLFLERDCSSLQVLTLDWKPHHATPLSLPLLSLLENKRTTFVKHCFCLLQLRKVTLECEATTYSSKTTTSLSATAPASSPLTLSLPSQNHTQQWLSQFISLCPNLQEVELRCTYYYFEDGKIYSVLRKLKHLERLTLDFCLCNYRSSAATNSIKSQQSQENVAEAITSTNGISTLFSHQQHQSSNLRYLKIMHRNRHTYRSLGNMLSGSVVDMVSCIKKYNVRLCELDISNIEFESTDQLVAILEDLKECRGLNTLKIRWPTCRCVCEKELIALSSLQDLEDLEIFAWYTVFSKPTLMRLFELRQKGGVRFFIVKISMNDGQYLGGHKRFTSPLSSSSSSSSPMGSSQVEQEKQNYPQCLHKKYSIYDKSVYRKEDKIEDIYCKECNSGHQWRILT